MLTPLSLRRLEGVHPDLVAVVKLANGRGVPFQVVEGRRSVERQKELVASGASRTLHSRHLTGHAVDLVVIRDGGMCWDKKNASLLAEAMKLSAKELKIPMTWGGDWPRFYDGPHFELDRSAYPDKEQTT